MDAKAWAVYMEMLSFSHIIAYEVFFSIINKQWKEIKEIQRPFLSVLISYFQICGFKT